MRVRLALAIAGVLAGPVVHAADEAQQAPIAGQDAMGDKSRSGPDGWSWAPVTRDQAPAGHAAGQDQATPNTRVGSNEGKTLPHGQDPGSAASPASSGPGSLDAESAMHKP